MNRLLLFLSLLFTATIAWSQGSNINVAVAIQDRGVAIARLPDAVANPGLQRVITDGASSIDCTAGSGSFINLCRSNGTSWVIFGGGGSGIGSSLNGQCLYNNNSAVGGITNCTTDGTNITAQTNTGTITSTLGTVITNTPILTATETLNAGGVTFKPFLLNYTNTASAAASRMFEIDVGGASKFDVDASGNVTIAGTLTTGGSAGYLGLGQGTCPALNANSFYLCTPASITTSYSWTLPGAENASAGIPHIGAAAAHNSTWTISAVALTDLATQAADSVVLNASGSVAAPTAVAMPTSGTNGCAGASNALQYNTTTHALGCGTISATGGATYTFGTPGFTLTVNQFCMVAGGSGSPCSATESARRVAVPAGTFTKAFVTTSGTQGASNTVLTLNKGGSSCNIVVTITANAVAGTFSDTAHSCTTVDGDYLDWAITGASTAASIVTSIVLAP